jgi:hypothetical protein
VSRTVRSPRRVLVPVVMAAVLALSGCAAGQISQTADEVAAVDGGNGTIGYMSVLNVVFAATAKTSYAKGGDAPLQLWLSNAGIQPDQLTGISTPAATSVQINGIKAIPGQTLKDLTGPTSAITLKGLTSSIAYGQSVPVTFAFATAGSLTVNVPIAIPSVRVTGRPTIDIQEPEQSSLYQPNGGSTAAGG